MRVLVTGGSGLVGRHLVGALASRGDEVTVTSRTGAVVDGARRSIAWRPADLPLPPNIASGLDAIVNLAGARVAPRPWTAARRQELIISRTLTTARCVAALGGDGPHVLVNASAIGYYGNTGERLVDETDGPGDDFLARLCLRWEAEARGGEERGARVVRLRFGHVLARGGGLLAPLEQATRLGLGTRFGRGRQWWSWIHVIDVVGLILHALDAPRLDGAINASAPEPARQGDFTAALSRRLRRPSFVRLPAPALRFALGDVSSVMLDSQRVRPAVALRAGYRFSAPSLATAFDKLYGA